MNQFLQLVGMQMKNNCHYFCRLIPIRSTTYEQPVNSLGRVQQLPHSDKPFYNSLTGNVASIYHGQSYNAYKDAKVGKHKLDFIWTVRK